MHYIKRTVEMFGHDLEITARAKHLNPHTGFVIDIRALPKILSLCGADETSSLTVINYCMDRAWDQLKCFTSGVDLFSISMRWKDIHGWSTLFSREDPVMIHKTQVFNFCAAHYLEDASLDATENLRQFGKCNGIHGHNYVLEVTMDDQAFRNALAAHIKDEVVDYFDHKTLNTLPEFHDKLASTEHLAEIVWDKIAAHSEGKHLYSVMIQETPTNFFEYYGPDEVE